MNAIELARKVTTEKQAHLFRPAKGQPEQYDAKVHSGSKRGWVLLDLFTASAIVLVHDALNEQNRAKFAALPIPKMASIAFKMVK